MQSNANRISLPATSASFDTTVTRAGQNIPKENSVTTRSVEDTIRIYSHANENEQNNKSKEKKKKSFFEMLATESKPVINFSESKVEKNYNTCELTKDTTEPLSKKRKIKVLPLEFNVCLSAPSTSSSASTIENGSTNASRNNDEEPSDSTDKKAIVKPYLKEVNIHL